MDKKNILIIEDDEFLRALSAKRLEKEGFGVAVAVDGDSGLAAARDTKPTIILLDLLLPGLSGFEVLERLKKDDNTKNIPVVVFSNLGQREDVEKATALGAASFLIKANFTLDDLVVKLNEQLANK